MSQISAVAVLTGDIIGFSGHSEETRRAILSVLHQEAEALHLRFPKKTPFPIGLYRGDGWQLVVLDPALALRIALLIRCSLKSGINGINADTRVAIAIGQVDFLPEVSMQTGDGEAFRASGRLLEAFPKRVHLGCRWPSQPSISLEEVIDAMLQLLDTLANQWTVKQARAVYGALQGWRQVDIARLWKPEPVSQQAVAQHLDSAAWYAVSHTLDVFENIIRSSLSPSDSGENGTI